MANDNMQIMKNILKIQDYFGRDFHSNGHRVTTDYILKVMIEANTEKVEKILQENMVQMEVNEREP